MSASLGGATAAGPGKQLDTHQDFSTLFFRGAPGPGHRARSALAIHLRHVAVHLRGDRADPDPTRWRTVEPACNWTDPPRRCGSWTASTLVAECAGRTTTPAAPLRRSGPDLEVGPSFEPEADVPGRRMTLRRRPFEGIRGIDAGVGDVHFLGRTATDSEAEFVSTDGDLRAGTAHAAREIHSAKGLEMLQAREQKTEYRIGLFERRASCGWFVPRALAGQRRGASPSLHRLDLLRLALLQ